MTRIAQRGSAQALLAAAALSFLRLSILGHQVATAASVSCTGPNTRYYSLDISQGYAAPDGFARPLYLVNGQTPGPLIEANQGETFLVNVLNRLPIEIGMHWHGLHQEGTPEYDGVPGVNQYAIPPGANMTYCFGTETNYGAYWYHVHLRDIYQDGIRGPLFIHSSSSNPRPYSQISNSSSDISAMQAAEQNPTVLMLNDWFHETSEAISGRLVATNDSMRPLCANSVQFNGMGRVQCPPASSDKSSFGCVSMMRMTKGMDSMGSMSMTETSKTVSKSKTASSANPPATSTAQMDMSGMNMGSSSKLSPTSTSSAMDSSMNMDGMDQVSGASIDPANTMCQDTDAPFYNLQLSSNSQWHMINLVNAGAAQMLSFSIDGHDLWIVSADGAFVKPQKIQILPIGIGQRYGIMLKRPDSSAATQYTIRASTMTHQTYQGNAVLTYVNSNSSTSSGSASSLPNSKPYMTIDGSPIDSSAKVLEDAALAPYPIYAVPNATRELRLMVNQSAPTVWVLEMGHAFNSNNGQQTPLLFAPRNASGVFSLERGEVVDVLLQISKDSLDTMAHPIHLHGHYFRVLGSSPDSTFPKDKTVAQMAQMGSSEYKINTRSDAPQRDSAHLPEAGWLAIRFASSNPGVWLLHCHINSHLSSGMAVAFIELAGELQQFPRNVTSPPPIAPYDPIPSLAK